MIATWFERATKLVMLAGVLLAAAETGADDGTGTAAPATGETAEWVLAPENHVCKGG